MKKKYDKGVIVSISLFIVGIMIGFCLSNTRISNIQGFLFNAIGYATNSNSTSSNATNSNATNSNATSSNATSSNATNSNATSGNVDFSYNVIYLEYFKLKKYNVEAGEKINVDFMTSGAKLYGNNIIFVDNNHNKFSSEISSSIGNSYIKIPSNVAAGTYKIYSISLYGRNLDSSTFVKTYTSDASKGIYFDFGGDIVISKPSKETVASTSTTEEKNTTNETNTTSNKKNKTESKQNENKTNSNEFKILFDDNKVSKGNKLEIGTFTYDIEDVTNITLKFKNENGIIFTTPVKNLASNKYIRIPSSWDEGKYALYEVVLYTKDGNKVYSSLKDNKDAIFYDFNISIEITEQKDLEYVYDNANITDGILSDIYSNNDKSVIYLEASENSLVVSDVFSNIKGTNKKLVINYNDNEIIFNGKDVTTAKPIDVKIQTSIITEENDVYNFIKDGILLTFIANGDLPGNATVRLRVTDEMKNKLSNNPIYIYYYNESLGKFSKIAEKVVETEDGYFEININHNSEYVLVTKELDKKLITTDSGKVVRFQKSNKVNIILICVGFVLIITAVVIIVLYKNKKWIFKENI